jgi:hypothetical protein
MLSYSPVTARAAVAMPTKKAPAGRTDIHFHVHLLSVGDLRRSMIQLYASVVPPSVTQVTYS